MKKNDHMFVSWHPDFGWYMPNRVLYAILLCLIVCVLGWKVSYANGEAAGKAHPNFLEVAYPSDSIYLFSTQTLVKFDPNAQLSLWDIMVCKQKLKQVQNSAHIVSISLDSILYRKLAQEAAVQNHLNWRILYSLWRKESNLDPTQIGDHGRAFGLGQVHLSTALACYDSSVTKERIEDPIEGGFVSAKVLAYCLQTFGGKYEYAIASYQAGDGATAPAYRTKGHPDNFWPYVEPIILNASVLQ
jgi:hypothetical protein